MAAKHHTFKTTTTYITLFYLEFKKANIFENNNIANNY